MVLLVHFQGQQYNVRARPRSQVPSANQKSSETPTDPEPHAGCMEYARLRAFHGCVDQVNTPISP